VSSRRDGSFLANRRRRASRWYASARAEAAAAETGGLDDPSGDPAATDRGQPGARAPQREGTVDRTFPPARCSKTQLCCNPRPTALRAFAASRGRQRVAAPRGHGRQRRETGRHRQRDPPAAERHRRARNPAAAGKPPNSTPLSREFKYDDESAENPPPLRRARRRRPSSNRRTTR